MLMRVLFLFALSSIGACKPNPLIASDADASDRSEYAAGYTTFPSGIWIDGDNTVWSVTTEGRELRAVAECGRNAGQTLAGTIQKNFIRYSVDGEDRLGMGEGRAMLVDSSHAYFIGSSDLRSHGLFHFNHVEHETACSAQFARRLPRENR
ncbi:MAG: hypothetical protein ABJG15_13720 [Hyphomonadaceae bacterium]